MLHEYERVEVLAFEPDWPTILPGHNQQRFHPVAQQSSDASDALTTTFTITLLLLFLSLAALAWGTVKVAQSAAIANQSPIPTQISGWERLK
jgi:hypothetical protein